MKIARSLSLLALVPLLSIAACQRAPEQPADPSPDAKPGLSVSDGTLVLPAVKGNPGAAYFTVTNASDVATSLAGVHIDGAGNTEMHETIGGSMSPVESVQLDAGATVKFERGGKHVMAFELADTLEPGGTAEITLTFSGGDKLSAPLTIEAAGGSGSMGSMDHGEHMEAAH
ncbi:MAG: copper chaperone PCu(A)C [Novosphingobium sp.]|nr:copper chaperone PCu(A)C [Novosphingobium sp.]MCP5402589.1 copper chaperone PCu(A)C [Novosphingobium sp.]